MPRSWRPAELLAETRFVLTEHRGLAGRSELRSGFRDRKAPPEPGSKGLGQTFPVTDGV